MGREDCDEFASPPDAEHAYREASAQLGRLRAIDARRWGLSLSFFADLAAIVGVLGALYAYGHLHRATKEHLEAHLSAVRVWAAGPKAEGWSDSDISDPKVMLKWHHPRFNPLPLPVTSGLSQLTTLENLLLSKELRQSVVGLGIAVEQFNLHLQELRSFDSGSVPTLVSVAAKLSVVYEASDSGGVALKKKLGPEVTMGGVRGSVVSVEQVLHEAGLTEHELAWAKFRFELLRTAHGTLIGSATAPRGIFGHLANVERVMRAEGLLS